MQQLLKGTTGSELNKWLRALEAVCGERNAVSLRAMFLPALNAAEGADRALLMGTEASERCAEATKAVRPLVVEFFETARLNDG